MSDIIISGITIRRDANGRYCLNDLHKAAGEEGRHKPGNWLMLDQTKALVAEIEIAGIPAIQSKQGLGTFVAKELVYAYAMWISAAFHLKVIRAYDTMVTTALSIPQNLPDALRLAADLADQKAKAEAALAIAAPKAEALDRLASQADGAVCLRIAAKLLQVPEKKFLQFAHAEGFIFRHHHSRVWQGYSDKAKAGLIELKLTTVTRDDGTEKTVEQVLITRAGLAKLAELLEKKKISVPMLAGFHPASHGLHS
ncbi:phage antirepressor KilAC domain-containing protein [Herbaspirillum huttiense]|uniref:phage antirepressor KilAC domain-containing protein n=1 Tax=Herbaspirillum huttiense TaxID=863372 RepID=UPI003F33003D